jgi:thiol-disulfide isomerase/thioredoxin
MKGLVEIVIVVMIALGIFILSAYLNVFRIYGLSIIGTSAIYLLSGIVLSYYYNETRFVLVFYVITGGLSIIYFAISGAKILIGPLVILLILSSAVGFSFPKMRLYVKIIAVASLVGIGVLIVFIHVPQKIIKNMASSNSPLIGKTLKEIIPGDVVLKTPLNQENNLSLPDDKIYLLEFYFSSCAPCRIKEKALTKLAEELRGLPFEVIYVNDGAIDAYKDFHKVNTNLQNRLYDDGGKLSKALHIDEFPTELIIDQQGVVRHLAVGYSNGIEQEYISKTVSKIKLLLAGKQ